MELHRATLSGRATIRRGAGLTAAVVGLVACQDMGHSDVEVVVGSAQALTGTINLQNGSNGYSGMSDAYIRQAATSANYGNAATCEVDGDDGHGADKSCLMQWDVSTVPQNAIVQSATLTLHATNGTSNTYQIYAAGRAWDEASVTWDQAETGASWQASGALGANDRGEAVGSVSGSGSRSISLNAAGIAVVQAWVNGDANNGFIIANSGNTDGIDFASSEYSTISRRPTLTISYSTGSAGTGGASSTGGFGTGGSGSSGSATGGPGTGGLGTGGLGTGGLGTGGGSSTAPESNLLVAFLGDQGNGSNADAVLNLVKSEGAAAAVHNGDFDYADSPASWNNRIDRILGPNYPYFAVVGNHDAAAWGGSNGYASHIAARVARVPEMQCSGDLGVKSTCRFRGLYMVQSCVGTSELTGHGNCSKDSTEQRDFLRDSLANDASIWSVCLWHKNQKDMQIGTKTDEVGWNAYRECMNAGAIVATGHEHSYSRTVALTDLGNAAAAHGKNGSYDALSIGAGRTFVFVSGLGGQSVRSYDSASHSGDTWWASQYASNRWMKSGTVRSGSGTYGAMFIRFHVDGNPRLARAYFKDVSGRVVDEFTIQVP